jgi:hypothetical protein
MDDPTAERERLDPLERVWRGRAVVLVAGLTVILVLVVSATGGVPSDLPGVALGSPALLHIERALLVGAAIAGSFIFLIRGWAGYFPSKLSTTGAEYAGPATVASISDGTQLAMGAIEDLRADQLAINRSMFSKLDEVRREMYALAALDAREKT